MKVRKAKHFFDRNLLYKQPENTIVPCAFSLWDFVKGEPWNFLPRLDSLDFCIRFGVIGAYLIHLVALSFFDRAVGAQLAVGCPEPSLSFSFSLYSSEESQRRGPLARSTEMPFSARKLPSSASNTNVGPYSSSQADSDALEKLVEGESKDTM